MSEKELVKEEAAPVEEQAVEEPRAEEAEQMEAMDGMDEMDGMEGEDQMEPGMDLELDMSEVNQSAMDQLEMDLQMEMSEVAESVESVPQPLFISEKHECFSLDKIVETDETLGMVNDRHILCEFCDIIILPEGTATKVKHEVNLLNNTEREYDLHSTYWHIDDIRKFLNIEVHQREGDLKYLCCFSCQSNILGYQIISNPTQIFIACDRVKLEI